MVEKLGRGECFAVSLGVVVLAFSLWSDCVGCGAHRLCRVNLCVVIPTSARSQRCTAGRWYGADLCAAGFMWPLMGFIRGSVVCKDYVHGVALWALCGIPRRYVTILCLMGRACVLGGKSVGSVCEQ